MAYFSNIPIGTVAYASIGTNTTDVAGQWWLTDIIVPRDMVITTVGFLQGGTATTDNVLAAIFDAGGNSIANSATAGVVLSGPNTFAERTLLTPVLLRGGATYFVGVQGNGTAAGAIQTVPTGVYIGLRAGSVAGAFGTIPTNLVVPTSFTTNKAPVVYLYG